MLLWSTRLTLGQPGLNAPWEGCVDWIFEAVLYHSMPAQLHVAINASARRGPGSGSCVTKFDADTPRGPILSLAQPAFVPFALRTSQCSRRGFKDICDIGLECKTQFSTKMRRKSELSSTLSKTRLVIVNTTAMLIPACTESSTCTKLGNIDTSARNMAGIECWLTAGVSIHCLHLQSDQLGANEVGRGAIGQTGWYLNTYVSTWRHNVVLCTVKGCGSSIQDSFCNNELINLMSKPDNDLHCTCIGLISCLHRFYANHMHLLVHLTECYCTHGSWVTMNGKWQTVQ